MLIHVSDTGCNLRPKNLFILALFLSLLVGLSPLAQAQNRDKPPQKTKNGIPIAPPVELVSARPSKIVKTISGFTRARARMKVVSEVSGRCLAVLADVGQKVPADGVMARLDDTFTRLEHEANLVEQKRIRTRLNYWQKEVTRYRRLVRAKSESQSRLDSLETDLVQASLQLKALKTQGDSLAERLSRYVIRAPAGWRVITRSVEPGQWVATGAVLAELGDYDTLLVPVALSPAEYLALRNMESPYRLWAPYQNKTVEARIERISPAFDERTRKTKVELAISGGLPEMRGGVQVEIELSMPDPSGAVLLPARALETRYQEKWLTKEDGSQVRVVDLGPGPQGLRRVVSKKVKPGERFRLMK